MKTICFFLGDVHGAGGISRVSWILANRLCDRFDVHVLSVYRNPLKKYEYREEVRIDYLFDTCMPIHKRIISLSKATREYIQKNQIEVFICAGEIYYIPSVLATIGLRTRLLCWEHSNVSVQGEHKFQNICRRIGAVFADEIVTLTKADCELYKKKYRVSNCQYIYNPVDDRLLTEVLYAQSSRKIVSVGRLCYQKNFEELIEIARIVLPANPDWSWDIYGEGEARESLKNKIDEYGLNRYLTLKGNVPNLYEIYKEYSFLVMTSRFEGFPMTLLESTAQGIPSIAYDVLTGPNEIIIEGKTGYLISNGNRRKMIERIEELISNQQIRKAMSDECVKSRGRFECTRIVEQWSILLERL